MSHQVNLQNDLNILNLPDFAKFYQWVNAALDGEVADTELTIRIVDEAESAQLNATFMQKNNPTNILAFPFADDLHELNLLPYLGDIAACAVVIEREANEQQKPLEAHWAHIIIHGTLHLLGYDHIHEHDAALMEDREIKLLNQFGFANPYEES